MSRLVRFPAAPALEDGGTPARVVSGDPRTAYANLHGSADGRFNCGVWESSPGAWQVDYTEEEFCVLLSGRVRLVGADGAAEEFGPGDAFVIPSGFSGTWETLEPVRKLYAIREP